jgi:glucoamylase
MDALNEWLQRQFRHAATALPACVSPCEIVKTRAGVGQVIRPKRGAIVASRVLGAYDPDPDYFFHWYRDSALVVDALRVLFTDAIRPPEMLTHFADFVGFTLSLQTLDGRTIVAAPGRRAGVAPDFLRHLRPDDELAAVHGDAVAAESRVNPDGTLDIFNWGRPQHDGPALRALAVLRWMRIAGCDAALDAGASALVRADLAFTRAHWKEPCFDIWEEERGLHYYNLCLSATALEAGADWLDGHADHATAQACRAHADAILAMLDQFWLETDGFYRSRGPLAAGRSPKDLDIAVILAAVHSGRSGDRHSVHDVRMHATLARLDELFDTAYPINHGRPAGRGPAMGRYAGDMYYSGGAYYFSTLAAAEFCFRAAMGAKEPGSLIARGDRYLATVRAFTPANGDLSEQFDQRTGEQSSARQLAWSYAAFITCLAARRAVRV